MAGLPEGFELEALLAPIPGDAPAGVDLREDFSPQSIYYRLRDARAEARATERAADSDPSLDPPLAQWRTVRELALSALATQTKDLELAAWCTEALVRLDGLAGLEAGARLIGGLTEAFWEHDIFPLPDEDGIETRVAPVTGLNGQGGDGTLMQPLRKLALFNRPDGSPFQLWQYDQSAELTGISDKERVKQRLEAGVVPFETVEKEAGAAGGAHFAVLRRAARAALEAWTAMGAALDARAGADGPPVARVREVLERILAVSQLYASDEPDAPEPEDVAPAGDGVAAEAGTGVAAAAAAAARPVTREDMLRDLNRIAEYFRRTEPQSPLSDTLEEAVRRARMTWPELLAELVPDTASRDQILVKLGIRPPSPPE
jgi:type VI secretion system protein ImpA